MRELDHRGEITMRAIIKSWAYRVREFLSSPVVELFRESRPGPDAPSQIQLALTYRQMYDERRKLPAASEVGFKAYSQADEDGILLFLFAVLGTHSKTCVEICAGDGIECNSANLILHHGWHGLLVDGDETAVERGRRFYGQSPGSYVYPPKFAC